MFKQRIDMALSSLELFFVHKGKLMMKFRDRDEIIKEGEFIIAPHRVEHCPVAITNVCEIVLLEPKTTIKTGNIKNTRKVQMYDFIERKVQFYE